MSVAAHSYSARESSTLHVHKEGVKDLQWGYEETFPLQTSIVKMSRVKVYGVKFSRLHRSPLYDPDCFHVKCREEKGHARKRQHQSKYDSCSVAMAVYLLMCCTCKASKLAVAISFQGGLVGPQVVTTRFRPRPPTRAKEHKGVGSDTSTIQVSYLLRYPKLASTG